MAGQKGEHVDKLHNKRNLLGSECYGCHASRDVHCPVLLFSGNKEHSATGCNGVNPNLRVFLWSMKEYLKAVFRI